MFAPSSLSSFLAREHRESLLSKLSAFVKTVRAGRPGWQSWGAEMSIFWPSSISDGFFSIMPPYWKSARPTFQQGPADGEELFSHQCGVRLNRLYF